VVLLLLSIGLPTATCLTSPDRWKVWAGGAGGAALQAARASIASSAVHPTNLAMAPS
jgi:hypothetical protein